MKLIRGAAVVGLASLVLGCGGSGSSADRDFRPIRLGDQWSLSGTVEHDVLTETLTEVVRATVRPVEGKDYLALSHTRRVDGVFQPIYGELIISMLNGESKQLGFFNGDVNSIFESPFADDTFYYARRRGEFNTWDAKITPYGQSSTLRCLEGEWLNTKIGRLWTWKVLVGTQLGPIPEDMEVGTMWYSPEVSAYVKVEFEEVDINRPEDFMPRKLHLEIDSFEPAN